MPKCPCGKQVQMIGINKKIKWYCSDCGKQVQYNPKTDEIRQITTPSTLTYVYQFLLVWLGVVLFTMVLNFLR